jgi:hypothetical protein
MPCYGILLIMEVKMWASGILALSYRLSHYHHARLDLLGVDNKLVQMQRRSDQTLMGHEAGVPLYRRSGGTGQVKSSKLRSVIQC